MEQYSLEKIAAAIRKKRISMGLTQEQAAEHVGISYSYYTKIENAIQAPALETLVKICEIYHISLDRLLLKWTVPGQISPEQTELLCDLQNINPEHIKICRSILDKLLAVSNEKPDMPKTPPQTAGH